MTTDVTHNEAASRYELRVDDQLVGFASYRRTGDELDFTHTEVEPEHEGAGLGTRLIEATLDDVERHSWTVLPHCWFMRDFIADHPHYLALVPADRRVAFGLPAE